MAREYGVGRITSRELADIGADETVGDIAFLFWENGWREGWKEYDDVYSGDTEPDWETVAAVVPPGTWLVSTVADPAHVIFELDLLARKPDGHLYVLNFDHIAEIVHEKYPALVGEEAVEHFERALSAWIKTNDMTFTGSMFGASDDDDDVAFNGSVDLSGLPVSDEKWEAPRRRT